MSYYSDQGFDTAMNEKAIYDSAYSLSDNDLIDTVKDVLEHPDYDEDAYTEMIENIKKNYYQWFSLTSKQRNAVCVHLVNNHICWY